MSKTFTLPGTNRKISLNLSIDPDLDYVIIQYGHDILQYKPAEISWKEYRNWLNEWLENGTIETINQTGRDDLKLLAVKFKDAVLGPNGMLISKQEDLRNKTRLLFTSHDADRFVSRGDILNLERLADAGIFPTRSGIPGSIYSDDLETLRWLSQQNPPILPDTTNLGYAASLGRINILRWLSELNPPILPNVNNINFMASQGYIPALDFYASLNPPVLPNEMAITYALQSGHPEVIPWLEQHGIRTNVPSQNNITGIPTTRPVIPTTRPVIPTTRPVIPTTRPVIPTMTTMNNIVRLTTEMNDPYREHPIEDEFNDESIDNDSDTDDENELLSHANELASDGNINELRRLAQSGIFPDIEGIYRAAENNHLNVLQFLYQNGVHPDIETANIALREHHYSILDWLSQLRPPIIANINPSEEDDEVEQIAANTYAESGNIERLIPLIQNNIYPDQDAVNRAAENDHLGMLRFLAQQNPPMLPDITGANNAAAEGNITILNFLAHQNPPILPNSIGATYAYNNGFYNIIDWLETRNPPILPNVQNERLSFDLGSPQSNRNEHSLSQSNQNESIPLEFAERLNGNISHGTTEAARNGDLPFLRWVAENRQIYPTVTELNDAAYEGHLNILEWAASLNPPIFPDVHGANDAAAEGYFNILEFLERHHILPNSEGSNMAYENGYDDVVEWLEDRGIYAYNGDED
jgi:hypothetical protein